MDKTITRTFLSLLSCVAVSMAASQSAHRDEGLTIQQQCALLLTQKPVSAKLDLSTTQAAAIDKTTEAYMVKSTELAAKKTLKDEDWMENERSYATALWASLNPTQKKKLLHEGISKLGIEALDNPAVVAMVGLNPTQVKQIHALYADYAKKRDDVSEMVANAILAIPEPKAGDDLKAYNKKCIATSKMYDGERMRIAKEKAEDEKKAVALMTPEQQAKWLELSAPDPVK